MKPASATLLLGAAALLVSGAAFSDPCDDHRRAAESFRQAQAFGVAGAAAIASAVFAGLSVDAKHTFDVDPTRGHADAFHRATIGTDIALAVTGAAAATGLRARTPSRGTLAFGVSPSFDERRAAPYRHRRHWRTGWTEPACARGDARRPNGS